ncbi:MAG: WXG100 family type VII secretion target [Anaerolineae bacterium]|jgi:WXG100 family type VII secretion target|nr:WXG100 family type VII secretion target [Anaerolineae bacterium]
MGADKIEVDYEKLETAIKEFTDGQHRTEQTIQKMRQSYERFSEGWLGTAGDAFRAEMGRHLFPRLNRLTEALNDSQRSLRDIIETFSEAENRAGALFSGGGFAGGGGGGGSAGAFTYDSRPLGSWSEWLKNIDTGLGLNDFLKRHGFFKSGAMLRFNQFLLSNYPELKPRWMQVLRSGAFTESISSFLEATGSFMDGNYTNGLLEISGGFAKMGIGALFDIPSKNMPGVGALIDGVVESIQKDDPAYAISGGLQGLVMITPIGAKIMLANSVIQAVGGGIGMVVYHGADFLSNGDPALADQFRQQSEAFQAALPKMDVTKVFDSAGAGIMQAINGDFSGGLSTLGGGVGDFLGGVGDTLFEGGKMGTMSAASLYERVTGIETGGLASAIGNLNTSQPETMIPVIEETAGVLVDTIDHVADGAKDIVNETTKQVTNLWQSIFN